VSERIDVPVAGGALAVYALGARRAGAPVAIAVHGITSTSRTWLAVARALGDRARLMALDLRGRGASARLGPPFGLDAHARDLLAVLDHLALERAVIAGHSLGAYVAARFATSHPERVRSLVLVDGGLRIPESEGVDRERFLRAFLGPTLERLEMTFPDVASYQRWWAAHPAVAGGDVERRDVDEYAAHDLGGEPPALRSTIDPRVVRDDGLDLFDADDALRLEVPAVLLCAPRGMVDDPNPMQPLSLARAWERGDPRRRRAVPVDDVNHYTIAWGARGAAAVADEIARALATDPGAVAMARP